MKRHPLFNAQEGDYFVLGLEVNRFAYVRIFKDGNMGVLPIISVGGILTVETLIGLLPCAHYYFLSLKADLTFVKKIGHIPFSNASEAIAPPCVKHADEYISYHQIYHRGQNRRATDEEIQGLQKWRLASPNVLAKAILEISADWPVITLPPTK